MRLPKHSVRRRGPLSGCRECLRALVDRACKLRQVDARSHPCLHVLAVEIEQLGAGLGRRNALGTPPAAHDRACRCCGVELGVQVDVEVESLLALDDAMLSIVQM